MTTLTLGTEKQVRWRNLQGEPWSDVETRTVEDLIDWAFQDDCRSGIARVDEEKTRRGYAVIDPETDDVSYKPISVAEELDIALEVINRDSTCGFVIEVV